MLKLEAAKNLHRNPSSEQSIVMLQEFIEDELD